MPNADVPAAASGRPSPALRHPRALLLLLLLLAGVFFHRPVLQALLLRGLQFTAARQGFVLKAQVSGNLLTQCSVENLRLLPKPGRPTLFSDLSVRRATFEYNPVQLLVRGADRRLSAVIVEGMELQLPESPKPLQQGHSNPQGPERLLKALAGFPLFWTEQARFSKVDIMGANPESGFTLRGGMFTALKGRSGVLAVDSFRLTGGNKPVAIRATTTLTNRRLVLEGLQLAPALELTRLALDASDRRRGVAKVQVEGRCGGGQFAAQLEAAPLRWWAHVEADHWKASELGAALGKTVGKLPDLVSARLDLEGNPALPQTWKGAARIQCALPVNGGTMASLVWVSAVENGTLKLTALEGVAPTARMAGSGKVELPRNWTDAAKIEGEAELHFECDSLSDWMPSPSLDKFGGALRGKATAKLARGGVQLDLDLQGESLRTGPFRLEHGRIEASLAAPILGLSNPDALSGNAVVSLTRPEYSTEALSVVLDEGACALALEGGNARFWNIVLKDSANVLAGEIAVSFASKPAPPNGSLQLTAKDLSLAKVQVLGRPLGGALEASWVGTLANGQPEGRLNASGRSLSWGAFGLNTFRAQASLERGELAVSESVLEWSSTESVRASGKVKLGRGGAYDLQAEAQLPNLERISPLFEQLGWAKTKVRGAMEARWSGTGSLGNPSGTGDWNLRIRQAQWEQIKLELFECGGHYAPGSLTVSPVRFTTKTTKFSAQIDWQPGALRCGQIALAQWGHPTLAGEFVLPLTYDAQGVHWVEDAQISGQLSADKLDLATLLSASGAPSPLQGTVQFAVTLSGRPSEPNCTLRASGNGLRITQAPQFGSSSMTLEGRYAQGILTAVATANTPFQGTIRIDASLPLPLPDLFSRKLAFENLPLQASLQAGPLNLAPLPKLWSGVRKISGSASLELKVNGSLQNPRWQGALKAECPLLHFASDRLPAVGSLTLGAEINQKEVRLTRLRADLGGGELEVQGAASFAAPGDPLLSFKAKAHELLVVRNSSLALRLNGDLFIKGPLRHAEISGSVSPTKSRVQRDIEVLPLNALRMEIPRETRVTGKPWFTLRKAPFSDWRFNVEVRTTPGDPVLLRGNRLRGSMDAEVRLEGTGAAPTLHGAYRSSDLTASLPFARIELSRGRIWYTRDHPFQPHVDFSAETEVRNHRIRLYLHGPANAPHISANSEPPEPEADLLTLIATGGLPGDSSENSQALTNRAASVLFQEFSEKVLPSGEHERFSALRRFSLDLGAINNRTGQQETRLTYRFMDNLFMIGEVGTGGDLAGRVRYLLRFR